MDLKQYDVQNFYPKYLDQDEVNEPLKVISDFFSADWLPGHLESLLEWRKHVIEEGYYTDEHKKSPAGLLFTHQLNARLVEAVYLISRTKRALKLANAVHINFDLQLQQEEQDWLHYPVHLSSAERINPYLAIGNFFKIYTVGQYLDLLYEWLETALSNHSADEFLDTSDVIYFYENMQKLYEAAWVIKQREVEPTLKKSVDGSGELASTQVKRYPVRLPLMNFNCRFNEAITTAEQLGLSQLVEIILKEIEPVLMIIHLGTHPDPDTFYLLIITKEQDKTSEHQLLDKIEKKCGHLINVCAIVHKSDAFLRALKEGSRFFINALRKDKIAYQSSKLELPELRNPDEIHIKNQVEAIWNRWGKQGKDFLDTSLSCFNEGNYNLAVFLMHQAVESTLSAIIRVNLGYRLSIHNLARQLRITLIFTDDLKNVFDFSVIEDVQLFELLQTAYSAARYKDDFYVDKDIVKALSDKVCKLFITAEGMYHQIKEQMID
ncbi:HEPN domain-containing protein [Mucilaginibacter pallidiroseus]|uniref:HEPN domain-containing protein n=1 Tax=Mucilaginibacter pallidiroseus TaxID=2599295 RepID=A0A563UJN9_9SPHI|nr:HEPN domain-containing protein [Mucilaginibacter pallidiroseus]TWR31506.1 HEPN domain-containing protein [Mucilaginibacter pallidiroseus]